MAFNPDEFLGTTAPAAQTPEQPTGFDPNTFLNQSQDPQAQADVEQRQDDALQAKYGSGSQQTLAGLEAAGRTTTFGLSSGLEKAAGVNPEDIKGRQEANPVSSTVGDVVGLISPTGLEGKILSKVGGKVAEHIVGEGILAGAKKGAVKLATENALYQSGDETSKMLLNDPNQSVGTAITNIGLAAAIGGATGGAIGSVSPLWKASVGNKTGQMVADFKGRINEHLADPNPTDSFINELGEYHKNIKSMADEVYGTTGLKSQEIGKLMPEMSSKISQSMEDLNSKAEKAMEDMIKKQVPDRYINKFKGELDQFQNIATKPDSTPSELFNAAQDFKQNLQGYSKGNFGAFAIPSYHEAYDFLNITKGLAHDTREALENPQVWGQAADRQLAINKAFSEYLPTLNDFDKKFTVEINGERVIDPGKASTYMNQLGKSNAEVKQSMLRNFLDASDKYSQVIADTHTNLGLDNPIPVSSLNAVKNTLKEQSTGSKLADIFIKHSSDAAGRGIAGGLGWIAGALSHVPGVGFALGLLSEHAAGPFLGKILPSIVKPLIEKDVNAIGAKAAVDYGMNVVKGMKLIDTTTKGIFKSGTSRVLPDAAQSDKFKREKLESAIQHYNKDPQAMTNVGGSVGHYMPDHAVAMGASISNIVKFLSSIKPHSTPALPLDKPRPVSQAVQSQYDRALDIAQQPLTVVDAIKQGTLTSHDIIALQVMYPQLYQGLKSKVMNAMVDHVSKEGTIPYGTRLGLSLFLGQPLDSTMTPNAILSTQPVHETPPQAPNQPKEQGLAVNKGNSLAKGSKSFQTASQASESMHSSGAKA